MFISQPLLIVVEPSTRSSDEQQPIKINLCDNATGVDKSVSRCQGMTVNLYIWSMWINLHFIGASFFSLLHTHLYSYLGEDSHIPFSTTLSQLKPLALTKTNLATVSWDWKTVCCLRNQRKLCYWFIYLPISVVNLITWNCSHAPASCSSDPNQMTLTRLSLSSGSRQDDTPRAAALRKCWGLSGRWRVPLCNSPVQQNQLKCQ